MTNIKQLSFSLLSVFITFSMTANAEDAADGEATYKAACFVCHDSGVANAPKLGDKAAWATRIATGKEALYTTALKGKGAMPPKGGRMDLSDDAVKATVDYMISKAEDKEAAPKTTEEPKKEEAPKTTEEKK